MIWLNTIIKNIVQTKTKILNSTSFGRKLVRAVIEQGLKHPATLDESKSFLRNILLEHLEERNTFARALKETNTPAGNNFEDITWLFASHQLTRGIIMLDLAEAAYMYRLLRDIPAAQCVEIGRFKGGCTFMLAFAAGEGGKVLSVDNYIHPRGFDFAVLEQELRDALKQYNLQDRVELKVDNSTSVPFENGQYDFVFIDADHSYEGVKADYLYWREALKPGGHLLFHDAAVPGNDLIGEMEKTYATFGVSGPMKMVDEIEQNDKQYFKDKTITSTLVHFVRTDTPW